MLDWDGLHLGDVPTWLAAVFTGGALFAGLRVLALQRRDLNDREGDRRKDQARHVSAWAVGVDEHEGIVGVQVAYKNGSDEPVYLVMIYVKSIHTDNLTSQRLGVLPPGRADETVVDVRGADLRVRDFPPPILISFRDAAGQDWFRDDVGLLTVASPARIIRLWEGDPTVAENLGAIRSWQRKVANWWRRKA